METTARISFRGFEPDESLRNRLEHEVEKLERYYDGIIGCRVAVELPHHRHEEGNLYHVGIRVTVPGQELVVSRDPPAHHAHEDVDVAVTDAFHAMRRRLEDYARKTRRQVKRHAVPPHGSVARLVPEEDHGFIETFDGREIYFHRNSVVTGSFDELAPGTEVRFAEEEGVEGPQASSVHVVGKHHLPSVEEQL